MTLVILGGASGFVGTASAADQEISGCTIISDAGVHDVTGDLVSSSNCIVVETSDVVIDGQGHEITQSGESSLVLSSTSRVSNVTVRNFEISIQGSGNAIEISSSNPVSDVTLENLVVNGGQSAVYVSSTSPVSNVTVKDFEVTDLGSGNAIEISSSNPVSDVTLENLVVKGGQSAVYANAGRAGSIKNVSVQNVTAVGGDVAVDVDTDDPDTTVEGISIVDSTFGNATDPVTQGVTLGGSGTNSTIDAEMTGTDLNATGVGMFIQAFDAESTVNLSVANSDIYAPGNGLKLVATGDESTVDLSVDESTVEAGNGHGIGLNLERTGGTNDVEVRDTRIHAGNNGVDLQTGLAIDYVNQTTNLTIENNNVTTDTHGNGLLLFPRGKNGTVDAEISGNEINSSSHGIFLRPYGNHTSVDLTLTDNTVENDDQIAVSMSSLQQTTTFNQTFEVEVAGNRIVDSGTATPGTGGGLLLDASSQNTSVNLSVTENEIFDHDTELVVVNANATANVDIRGNEFDLLGLLGAPDPQSVYQPRKTLSADIVNNTVYDPLNVDPRNGVDKSIELTIGDNDILDVIDGDDDHGITVRPSGVNTTASVTVVDNDVDMGSTGLRFRAPDDRLSADVVVERNDINSSVGQGINVFAPGANSTVDLRVASNAINGSNAGMFLNMLGDDAISDVDLLDNDVNVTGGSGAGIRLGTSPPASAPRGVNTSLSLVIAENDIDGVDQGIDLPLVYDDDPKYGGGDYDVDIAGNDIRADVDAIGIDPSSHGMNASLTITDNVLRTEEEAGINLASSNPTQNAELILEIRGNDANTSWEPVYVKAGGDDTNVTVRVLGNDLESEFQDGVYVDLSDGERGSRTVAVAGNDVTARDSDYGVYLKASATEAAADMNLTANSVNASTGLYLETWEDNQQVDQFVSNNEITADGYGAILYAEGDGTEANLTMGGNVIDAESGMELNLGDPGATVDATVEANDIEADTLGIDFRGATILDADRFDVVVRENHVNASETGIEVEPEAGSGTVDDGLVIEHNEIRGRIRGVLLADETAPVEGIELHRNVLAGGSYGVENENMTAGSYVDATNNYWNASDGPNSSGPYDDPVTGTLADGSGSNVTNVTASTVSNVHFDPWLSSAPKVDFDDDGGSDDDSDDESTNDDGTDGTSSSVSSSDDDDPDPVTENLADAVPDEAGVQVPIDDGPVEELSFEDENLDGSGEVSVEHHEEAPEAVADEFGSESVVSAVDIEVPDIATDASARISFHVTASELGDRDPESLQVVRVVDSENQRLTTEVNEDANGGYVVEADTPGFSTFAVVSVEEQTQPVTGETPTATPETTPTPEEPPSTATEPPTRTETPGGLDGFGALAALVAIVVAGLYARQRRR